MTPEEPMSKSVQYRKQADAAAKSIEAWPSWMREGITPPQEQIEMSKSMEKRLRAQRIGPIAVADIESNPCSTEAVLALCAALRELAEKVYPTSRANILARHNIVLDREGA